MMSRVRASSPAPLKREPKEGSFFMRHLFTLRLSHGLPSQSGSWHARSFVWLVPRLQILVLGLLAVRKSVVLLTRTSWDTSCHGALAKIRLAAYMILRNQRFLESSHLVSRSIKKTSFEVFF